MGPIKYRPDIDGLRAVAVLAVVLFHAEAGLLGGYVGVDIFFVISGYLITSIVARQIDRGNFSLKDFWLRRIKRIAPALIAVVAVTLAIAATFMLPRDFEKLAKSAVAQTVGVSNFYFWQDTGYFSGAAETKPLLHTWSLAVEEQFYILLPLVLVYMSRLRRRRTVGVLATAAAASLAWSIFEVNAAPSTAFFLLPSRAWELLAGSLLAYAPALSTQNRLEAGKTHTRFVPEFLALSGLSLILASVVLYTPDTVFPGPHAIAPVLGTCLVIYAGIGQTTLASRLLSWSPLVRIGLISYSLYLWHWPLFAFARYWFHPLPAWLSLSVVAASFALAVLSYHFIETPFRRNSFGWSTGPICRGAVALQLTIAAVAITIDQRDGFPARMSDELHAMSDGNGWANTTHEDIAAGHLVPLGIAEQSTTPDFILWGDSHAGSLVGMFDESARAAGLRGLAAINGFDQANLVARPGQDALQVRNRQIEDHIVQAAIPHVFIVQRWERAFGYLNPEDSEFNRFTAAEKAEMNGDLAQIVARLTSAGCRVYLLDQVPRQEGEDLLRAELFRATMLENGDLITNRKSVLQHREDAFWRPILQACQRHPNVALLNIEPYCFDESGQSQVFVAGQSCYRDDDHLSNHGARTLLRPLIAPILEAIATSTPPMADPAIRFAGPAPDAPTVVR